MSSESRSTLRWLVKRGFQFASSLLPDDASVLRDYDIYHDKAVMTNMLLQTLSTLLLQNLSYYISFRGGANVLLTLVQACAKQSPAIVPLNSID
jgi:hypothetical protein